MKKIKLSVNCWNENLFYKLLNTKVDKIIFGIKGFSCRFNNYITLDQLRNIVKNKNDKKISICLNNLYHENEIKSLEKLLKELSTINIDELIFHDFAIAQIVYENNYDFRLNYNPETLNVNYGQVDFFIKNGFSAFTLARELLISEVIEIANNKKTLEIEMQIHGFTFFMHSNWKIISNFKKYLDTKNEEYDDNSKFYEIREDLRTLKNLIYEDHFGTHMFSGFVLCGCKKIKQLENIDYLKIDPIFRTENWAINVINIYYDLLENRIDENECYKRLSNLEKEYKLSESFLGKISEMPHIEKGVDNEQ